MNTQAIYRAILIDPQQRTLTEIHIKRDDHKEIQRVLGCQSFTIGAHLSGSIERGFDAVYATDDLLEDRDDPRFWFQVDADRDPPSSFPIAGLGLAVGADSEGRGCDVRIGVAELASPIKFMERKFRGFSVSSLSTACRLFLRRQSSTEGDMEMTAEHKLNCSA